MDSLGAICNEVKVWSLEWTQPSRPELRNLALAGPDKEAQEQPLHSNGHPEVHVVLMPAAGQHVEALLRQCL